MSFQDYFNKMELIQKNILEFLDDNVNPEQNFANLSNFFIQQKISENRYQIKSLFHLLLMISKYHHRSMYFFAKIEKIIKQVYYSNSMF